MNTNAQVCKFCLKPSLTYCACGFCDTCLEGYCNTCGYKKSRFICSSLMCALVFGLCNAIILYAMKY